MSRDRKKISTDREYLMKLANALDRAEREHGVIKMSDELAKQASDILKQLTWCREGGRKQLLLKYKELEEKRHIEEKRGNKPQTEIYKQKQKEIRSTIGILGINIKGINC